MKHFVHVARLALIIQTLRYACGESNLQNVDSVSVKAAIKLNDYFEDSYQRIRHFLSVESCEEPQMELLNLLQDSFTTAQAIEIGKQLHVTERTVMNYLKGLEKNRLIHKVKQGNYEKRNSRTEKLQQIIIRCSFQFFQFFSFGAVFPSDF
jgi:DNA-binding transcriptional ArsR family regulator